MENPDHHPENLTTPFDLQETMRRSVAAEGGIAAFIRARVRERTESYEEADVHRASLRQMERIARAVALPHSSLTGSGDKERANAFYWGEIMAMELGDLVFSSHDWAEALRKHLNDFHVLGLSVAHDEIDDPVTDIPSTATNVSDDAKRALLTAHVMVGALESEDDEGFDEDDLRLLGSEYAAELTADDESRHFVTLGYRLVMAAFDDHMDEVLDADHEIRTLDVLEAELSDVPDWDTLAAESGHEEK